MDELKALYFRIENPIDNKNKWNKIIYTYSTSFNYDDFYQKLTSNKQDGIYYIDEDKDNFCLAMWSIWKQKLLSFTEEELKNLIDRKIFESNIYEVVKEVNKLESVRNITTLKNILTNPEINRYFSCLYDDFDNDIVITSRFGMRKESKHNIVLSILVDASNLYKLLQVYVNQCNNNEIDYYIKFNEQGKKINVEIYASYDNLKKSEDILNVLKKEYYTFFNNNISYNVLAGNINDWIGIRTKDAVPLFEYLKSRSSIVYKALDSVLYEYIISHLNILVSYKDGRMNLVEYLSTCVMESVVTKLLSNSIRTSNDYFMISNSDDFINLKNYIKDKLSLNIKNILKDRLYLKNSNDKITLKLNNNKSIDIEVSLFMTAIRNLIHPLLLKDRALEKRFRVRIKNECQFYKVDPDKFCLDSSFAKKIFFDSKKLEQYQSELEKIHSEIKKLDDLDKLINSEINQDVRDKISASMTELLNVYED